MKYISFTLRQTATSVLITYLGRLECKQRSSASVLFVLSVLTVTQMWTYNNTFKQAVWPVLWPQQYGPHRASGYSADSYYVFV